jgi:hypothetical protein
MHETITFTHPQDPDLVLTIGRPSEEAWADAFNTMSTTRSREAGVFAAGYNLTIATAKGITRAELPRLIDDWPMATGLVLGSSAELGGGLTLASKADPDSVNAWPIDLKATVEAAKEIAALRAMQSGDRAIAVVVVDTDAGTARARLEELLAEYTPTLEALAASGLTLEACADLCAQYNRRGQLLAWRTRDHGVIIAKRPGFQASMAFANDCTDSGHYEASKRLCIACIVRPAFDALAPRLAEYPALTSSLAGLIRAEVQGGLGATVKKG